MPRDLFASPPDHPDSRRNTRLLPASVALHALLIVGVIIAPLLATGDLPKITGMRTPAWIVKTVPVPEVVPTPAHRAGPPTVAKAHSTAPSLVAPSPNASSINLDGLLADEPFPMDLPTTSAGSVEGLVAGGGSSTGGADMATVPSGPVRPGGNIETPRKIRHVAPEYPAIAQQVRKQGTVVIDAIIGPDGRVTQATIRRSEPLLDQPALAAVRQWVYTPTKLNGMPVAVIMTVEVHFRLQ